MSEKKTTKNLGGRPKKGPLTPTDFEWFEKLCSYQCTLIELSGEFRCDDKTLIKRVEEHYEQSFSSVFKSFREAGKTSLRRAMFKKALEGSTAMMIHLSKNYLGMYDKAPIEELAKSVVYSTQIGQGGEILTEIKSKEDWDKQKNFDAAKILKEEQKKKKTKKKSNKKI